MDESETTPLRPSRRRSMLQLRNSRHRHSHYRRPSDAERSTGENSMGSVGSSHRTTTNATAGNNSSSSSTNKRNHNYLSKFFNILSSSFSESSSSRTTGKGGDYNSISSCQQPSSQEASIKGSYSLPNISTNTHPTDPLNSTTNSTNHANSNPNPDQLHCNNTNNNNNTNNSTNNTIATNNNNNNNNNTTKKKPKKFRKK